MLDGLGLRPRGRSYHRRVPVPRHQAQTYPGGRQVPSRRPAQSLQPPANSRLILRPSLLGGDQLPDLNRSTTSGAHLAAPRGRMNARPVTRIMTARFRGGHRRVQSSHIHDKDVYPSYLDPALFSLPPGFSSSDRSGEHDCRTRSVSGWRHRRCTVRPGGRLTVHLIGLLALVDDRSAPSRSFTLLIEDVPREERERLVPGAPVALHPMPTVIPIVARVDNAVLSSCTPGCDPTASMAHAANSWAVCRVCTSQRDDDEP
jgi:hypothetical protein